MVKIGARTDEIWVASGTVAVFSGATTFGNQIICNAGISGTIYRGSNVVFTGSVQAQSVGVPLISTGSPSSVTNTLIQVGESGTSAAGSLQWIAFYEKFGAVPQVIVSVQDKVGGGDISTGSVSAGSFVCYTINASETFDWIAIGTKG